METTRGCKHVCRHCPITPIYAGRFFAVPREVVLEDIRRQAAEGARHITFGDPDFLNGPAHAQRIVQAMHQEFPGLTFDFTAKIEHILKHADAFPEFAASGCLFVISAAESLSDGILERLRKGHTGADVRDALRILRRAGLSLRPTFIPFTPWTTIRDYLDILDFIEEGGLVDEVAPVQLSLRLLIPPQSAMLEVDDLKPHLVRLEPENFTWVWRHPDPRMDELQREISRIAMAAADSGEDAALTFRSIRRAAAAVAGVTVVDAPLPPPDRPQTAAPYGRLVLLRRTPGRPARSVLTRISHQLSTTATDPPVTTCVSARARCNVPSRYALAFAGLQRGVSPGALRRLATKPGEKCGLIIPTERFFRD
ncbi:MAG: radical SAM protein [Deltaproteobacteria bacterium]|nr:radical SAM protein [Deltaproteobacteria bacterium]